MVRRAGARRLLAALLLLAGVPALPVGIVDVLSPVSVRSQLVGISYLVSVAGLITAGGGVMLIRRRVSRSVVALVAAAAVYVWSTLALYAYAARRGEAIVFGVLALLSALAGVALFRWHTITGDRDPLALTRGKVTAAGVGLLITAAQLWYSSVYLPANLDVGIAFTAAIGVPRPGLRQVRLVPVGITVQNTSSVSAVALTSMFTVVGLRYRDALTPWASAGAALRNEEAIGTATNFGEQKLNVALSSVPSEQLLAIGRVVGDGRLMFPNVLNPNQLVVAVPPGVQALELHVYLDYARETRLQLAGIDPSTGLARPSLGPYSTAVRRCAHDVLELRRLRQSLLQRLTRGDEAVATNWCFDPGSERTFSFVADAPSGVGSGPSRAGLRFALHACPHGGGTYGLLHTQRVWTFPLPAR